MPTNNGKRKTRDSNQYSNNITFDSPEYISKLETFLDYYKKQGVLSNDQDCEKLTSCLKTELPTCFWVSTKENFHESFKIMFAQESAALDKKFKFERIEWCEKTFFNSAFKSKISKRFLKKADDPELKKFRSWFIGVTESGAVVRQEEVSMIPPLVLDVKAEHKVLDLCAAPGSKTCQILEMVQNGSEPLKADEDNRGIVVANDQNGSRCHVLHGRIKSAGYKNYAVVCGDARHLRKFKTKNGETVLFDRVLCDVPCSGDGTIRKCPVHSMLTWSEESGNSLHKLQLDIAKKGVLFLKEGGVMVYSTCSLNPTENEAVVSELLDLFDGAIELVEIRDTLPGLRWRDGLTKWKVPVGGKLLTSYEEVEEKHKKKIKESMFPKRENSELTRCKRVVPCDSNTGGFFIAKFKKVRGKAKKIKKVYPEKQESKTFSSQKAPNPEIWTQKEENFDAVKLAEKISQIKNPMLVPFRRIQKELQDKISDYFGIKDENFLSSLAYRSNSQNPPSKIYTIPSSGRDLVIKNDSLLLKVVGAGIPVFSRDKHRRGFNYRFMHEGIAVSFDFFGKRKVSCQIDDIEQILAQDGYRKNLPDISSEKFRNTLKQLERGSIAFFTEYKIRRENEAPAVTEKMIVVGYLEENFVELMVGKKWVETLKQKIQWIRENMIK